MIRRTDDYSGISNQDLNKIADAVKKSENKKMYDSFNNEYDADVAASELKIQGYKTSIKKIADRYEVYAEKPDTVPFDEAEQSGQFKKLAWGRYCFQRESALGMFDYKFDDGSIWKLSQDEKGNQILIKQIDESNPDEVIRLVDKTINKQETKIPIHHTTKVAANKRKKFDFVNANNLDVIAKILYNSKINEELKKDIIISNSKNLLNNMNYKFNKIIDEKIIEVGIDERDVEEVKSLILTALNEEIQSKETLNSFLKAFKGDKFNKVGKLKKRFEQ